MFGKNNIVEDAPNVSEVALTASPSPLIAKILVSGYQSLYRVQLDLGMFTVIHGESNVGKSGFYRAIRALLTAEPGEDFISIGEKKAGVVLQFSSGQAVAWIKERGKTPNYKLGEKTWRRAESVPREILDLLRMGCIKVGSDTYHPNFRGQFDSLFLLFESSAKRAKVLGALVSNILLQGIREANIERNRNEADVRSLEGIVSDIEKEEKVDWDSLEERADTCVALRERIKRLRDLQESVQFMVRKRHYLQAWQSEISAVDLQMGYLMPEAEKFFKMATVYETLLQKRKALIENRWLLIKEPILLPKEFFERGNRLVEVYEKLLLWYTSLSQRQAELERAELKRKSVIDKKAAVEREVLVLEKEMRVRCPICKGEFSMLDIK